MIPNRECPKCPRGQGIMDGESQEIPMRFPLPIPLNPTINLEYIFQKFYNVIDIMLFLFIEVVVLLNFLFILDN